MNLENFVLKTVQVIILMTKLNLKVLILIIAQLIKNHIKTFDLWQFGFDFDLKLSLVQNRYVLDSVK